MGKYFGTDGIRGKANETLSIDTAFKVGLFLGKQFVQGHRKVLIGKDTRLSSGMFESALAAGFSAGGSDVYLLGVCSTPALAYLTKRDDFDCGVMISASHNPYYDNGIKCFASNGVKISAKLEDAIEAYLDGNQAIELAVNEQIGHVYNFAEGLVEYRQFIESLCHFSLKGKKIVLDLANGSATSSARAIFESLGASLLILNDKPNGININTKCGSTHPEMMVQAVVDNHADMGFAFDGDADRCIACDHLGNLIDGDKILYACGLFMKEQGKLVKDTIVTTVMANLGFYKLMSKLGISTAQTQVGDKYVYDCMVKEGYVLGGEQSGHIIFKEYATTGDGVLTALKLAEVAVMRNESLYDITKDLVIYPQLLKNVKVQDKYIALENQALCETVSDIEHKLGDDGRILVRPSGTEPLVRIMVEAVNADLCRQYVEDVIDVIQKNRL